MVGAPAHHRAAVRGPVGLGEGLLAVLKIGTCQASWDLSEGKWCEEFREEAGGDKGRQEGLVCKH